MSKKESLQRRLDAVSREISLYSKAVESRSSTDKQKIRHPRKLCTLEEWTTTNEGRFEPIDNPNPSTVFVTKTIIEALVQGEFTDFELNDRLLIDCSNHNVRLSDKGSLPGASIDTSIICGVLQGLGAIKYNRKLQIPNQDTINIPEKSLITDKESPAKCSAVTESITRRWEKLLQEYFATIPLHDEHINEVSTSIKPEHPKPPNSISVKDSDAANQSSSVNVDMSNQNSSYTNYSSNNSNNNNNNNNNSNINSTNSIDGTDGNSGSEVAIDLSLSSSLAEKEEEESLNVDEVVLIIQDGITTSSENGLEFQEIRETLVVYNYDGDSSGGVNSAGRYDKNEKSSEEYMSDYNNNNNITSSINDNNNVIIKTNNKHPALNSKTNLPNNLHESDTASNIKHKNSNHVSETIQTTTTTSSIQRPDYIHNSTGSNVSKSIMTSQSSDVINVVTMSPSSDPLISNLERVAHTTTDAFTPTIHISSPLAPRDRKKTTPTSHLPHVISSLVAYEDSDGDSDGEEVSQEPSRDASGISGGGASVGDELVRVGGGGGADWTKVTTGSGSTSVSKGRDGLVVANETDNLLTSDLSIAVSSQSLRQRDAEADKRVNEQVEADKRVNERMEADLDENAKDDDGVDEGDGEEGGDAAGEDGMSGEGDDDEDDMVEGRQAAVEGVDGEKDTSSSLGDSQARYEETMTLSQSADVIEVLSDPEKTLNEWMRASYDLFSAVEEEEVIMRKILAQCGLPPPPYERVGTHYLLPADTDYPKKRARKMSIGRSSTVTAQDLWDRAQRKRKRLGLKVDKGRSFPVPKGIVVMDPTTASMSYASGLASSNTEDSLFGDGMNPIWLGVSGGLGVTAGSGTGGIPASATGQSTGPGRKKTTVLNTDRTFYDAKGHICPPLELNPSLALRYPCNTVHKLHSPSPVPILSPLPSNSHITSNSSTSNMVLKVENTNNHHHYVEDPSTLIDSDSKLKNKSKRVTISVLNNVTNIVNLSEPPSMISTSTATSTSISSSLRSPAVDTSCHLSDLYLLTEWVDWVSIAREFVVFDSDEMLVDSWCATPRLSSRMEEFNFMTAPNTTLSTPDMSAMSSSNTTDNNIREPSSLAHVETNTGSGTVIEEAKMTPELSQPNIVSIVSSPETSTSNFNKVSSEAAARPTTNTPNHSKLTPTATSTIADSNLATVASSQDSKKGVLGIGLGKSTVVMNSTKLNKTSSSTSATGYSSDKDKRTPVLTKKSQRLQKPLGDVLAPTFRLVPTPTLFSSTTSILPAVDTVDDQSLDPIVSIHNNIPAGVEGGGGRDGGRSLVGGAAVDGVDEEEEDPTDAMLAVRHEMVLAKMRARYAELQRLQQSRKTKRSMSIGNASGSGGGGAGAGIGVTVTGSNATVIASSASTNNNNNNNSKNSSNSNNNTSNSIKANHSVENSQKFSGSSPVVSSTAVAVVALPLNTGSPRGGRKIAIGKNNPRKRGRPPKILKETVFENSFLSERTPQPLHHAGVQNHVSSINSNDSTQTLYDSSDGIIASSFGRNVEVQVEAMDVVEDAEDTTSKYIDRMMSAINPGGIDVNDETEDPL